TPFFLGITSFCILSLPFLSLSTTGLCLLSSFSRSPERRFQFLRRRRDPDSGFIVTVVAEAVVGIIAVFAVLVLPIIFHCTKATELGRVPSQSEVFLRTHTRKKDRGQFVDERSEQQIEQHKAEIKHLEDELAARIAAGEPAGPPIDEDEVWDRIAGGRKRGRVYGKGKVPKRPVPRLVDPKDASTCSGPDVKEHITLLNREIQQQAEM
ncbi:hypothetical protein PIB30_091874, partial [Stylosanthes scabra]|nr:hypothetical protein [Stylosanthes scabra]